MCWISLRILVPICVLFIITFMTGGVGGSTKKFAFGAAYQLGYAVGNIIGPQTYRANDAPNYYVRLPDTVLLESTLLLTASRLRNTQC